MKKYFKKFCRLLRLCLLCIAVTAAYGQVRPTVALTGGDDVPVLKKRCETVLESVLLEMNRLSKGGGDESALKPYFSGEAFPIFQQFVLRNKAYTARKKYEPLMIQREHGEYYDVRGVTVKVDLGGTEASDNQTLVFTFAKSGIITSVRAVLPNYDYEAVISNGKTPEDSLVRGKILDFLERFRMAYNSKDIEFLEKVYSDDALILVGTVLREKQNSDDVMKTTTLSTEKVKLIQQTKQEYLDALKDKAFKNNSFINVRFDSVQILQHERIPYIYGISCWQQWNASNYSDRGYLFLMMDFRNNEEPIIHVRTWQPRAFEDGSFVSLYDFDVVEYK